MTTTTPGATIGSGAMVFGTAMVNAIHRRRARRAAYVEAVIEARDREAMQRRIRTLEAALHASRRQDQTTEVNRRLASLLSSFKG